MERALVCIRRVRTGYHWGKLPKITFKKKIKHLDCVTEFKLVTTNSNIQEKTYCHRSKTEEHYQAVHTLHLVSASRKPLISHFIDLKLLQSCEHTSIYLIANQGTPSPLEVAMQKKFPFLICRFTGMGVSA